MQRFLLKFAALATTVPVVYGGIISTRISAPPASPVTSAALQSSVSIALDIPTKANAIFTHSDITLPTNAAVPDSPAWTDPGLCSASCPECNGLPINEKTLKTPVDILRERALNTPANENNNLTRFLTTEYGFAEFVRLIPMSLSGYSSGFGRKLVKYKYNAAVGGLHGCTSVIVISQSAIWLSHFWELPSFRDLPTTDTGRPGRAPPRTAQDKANFEDDVLYQMEYGGLHMPGLLQFTHAGGDFSATEDPRWIVVTPRIINGRPGRIEYMQEVTDIIGVLRELFPNSPPLVIDYVRKSRQELQRNVMAGKLLVQYDPYQEVRQTPTNPCEIHQRAIIRLWIQDGREPVFEHTWNANSEQLVSEDWRNPTCSLPSNLPQARRAITGPNLVYSLASTDAVPGSEVLANPRRLFTYPGNI